MATNDEGNAPAIDVVSNIQVFLYYAYTHFYQRPAGDRYGSYCYSKRISCFVEPFQRLSLASVHPFRHPLFYVCCKLTIT